MMGHPPADETVTDPTPAPEPTTDTVASDWNPRGPQVRRDPVAAYDKLRSRCPVARDANGTWTLFSHAHVTAAALDPETFSNAVSHHLQIPNGLDGPTHTTFRALVEDYFTPERMRALEPTIHQVATDLVAGLKIPGPVDVVALGSRFAVRAQTAWLGWPADLEDELLQWMQHHRAATRSRDHSRTTEVAQHFDTIIRAQTGPRREAGDDASEDVTTELVRDCVDGRELTEEEIVSILRNWTGGDLGSVALCAGVVLTYLADHPKLQTRLRCGVPEREFNAILDEILRIDDPFVANRRITTEAVTVGGRRLAAGDRVILNWTAANRDPRMVGDPEAFDPVGNAPYNLVYGIGKHVCPGRPLATLELRALTRALLEATAAIEPEPGRARKRERPPAGGFAASPLHLR